MEIVIIYSSKLKSVETVAKSMANFTHTHARKMGDYPSKQTIDLLVVVFSDTLFRDRELYDFLAQTNRNTVRNVALVNAFYRTNKKMHDVIAYCHQKNLPLMREHYSWKQSRGFHFSREKEVVDGALLYLADMIQVIEGYY